jgi:hypothetical protein
MLCIADSWPSQARTVWGDHARFEETYFSQVPVMYFTGDRAQRDKDGYYWITGRIDDVLNVSGHKLGTAEIESALEADDAVAEAAVVDIPHDIKGQGIYAYVTLKAGMVRRELPPFGRFRPVYPRAPSGAVAHYSFNTLNSIMSGDSARMASRAPCGGALSRWMRATAAAAPSKTTFSVSWTLMPARLSWLKTAESTPTRS